MSSSKNAQRDAEIVAARRQGTASLEELSERYGITVERVRQIQLAGGVNARQAADAYTRRRAQSRVEEASRFEDAILIRWIGGESVSEIANSLSISVSATQEILDEHITDENIAARRNTQTAQHFPSVPAGPIEEGEARDDRRWTRTTCLHALYWVAQANGGVLPSTVEYKKMSTDNDDLPSFPTVRNRCGRWTQVRVDIGIMLRQARA